MSFFDFNVLGLLLLIVALMAIVAGVRVVVLYQRQRRVARFPVLPEGQTFAATTCPSSGTEVAPAVVETNLDDCGVPAAIAVLPSLATEQTNAHVSLSDDSSQDELSGFNDSDADHAEPPSVDVVDRRSTSDHSTAAKGKAASPLCDGDSFGVDGDAAMLEPRENEVYEPNAYELYQLPRYRLTMHAVPNRHLLNQSPETQKI